MNPYDRLMGMDVVYNQYVPAGEMYIVGNTVVTAEVDRLELATKLLKNMAVTATEALEMMSGLPVFGEAYSIDEVL